MKTYCLPLLLAFLLFLSLFSCTEKGDFESNDAKFIFSARDIKGLGLSDFQYERLGKDKHYLYAKFHDDLNGQSYFYSERLLNGGKNDILLTTSVNIQSDEKAAMRLYKTAMTIMPSMANIMVLNPGEYNIDEGSLSRAHNINVINIRKGKLFYQITIDGIEPLTENQFKDDLIEKIGYIVKNGYAV